MLYVWFAYLGFLALGGVVFQSSLKVWSQITSTVLKMDQSTCRYASRGLRIRSDLMVKCKGVRTYTKADTFGFCDITDNVLTRPLQVSYCKMSFRYASCYWEDSRLIVNLNAADAIIVGFGAELWRNQVFLLLYFIFMSLFQLLSCNFSIMLTKSPPWPTITVIGTLMYEYN